MPRTEFVTSSGIWNSFRIRNPSRFGDFLVLLRSHNGGGTVLQGLVGGEVLISVSDIIWQRVKSLIMALVMWGMQEDMSNVKDRCLILVGGSDAAAIVKKRKH